jgi:hypothetical protein
LNRCKFVEVAVGIFGGVVWWLIFARTTSIQSLRNLIRLGSTDVSKQRADLAIPLPILLPLLHPSRLLLYRPEKIIVSKRVFTIKNKRV